MHQLPAPLYATLPASERQWCYTIAHNQGCCCRRPAIPEKGVRLQRGRVFFCSERLASHVRSYQGGAHVEHLRPMRTPSCASRSRSIRAPANGRLQVQLIDSAHQPQNLG